MVKLGKKTFFVLSSKTELKNISKIFFWVISPKTPWTPLDWCAYFTQTESGETEHGQRRGNATVDAGKECQTHDGRLSSAFGSASPPKPDERHGAADIPAEGPLASVWPQPRSKTSHMWYAGRDSFSGISDAFPRGGGGGGMY